MDEHGRRMARARHLVEMATSLGIRLGTNGEDVATMVPLSLDRTVRRQFDDLLADLRAEVIAVIEEDIAARSAPDRGERGGAA